MPKKITIFFLLSLVFLLACDWSFPDELKEEDILDGPLEGLTMEQQLQFLKGDIAFNDEIFTAEKGLGPVFVANSCGSCHPGDGKGHPFIGFTRFGQKDTTGNLFLEMGGPQLQHKAIPGFIPEEIPPQATSTILLAPAVTGLGFLDAMDDKDIIAMSDPNDKDGDGISGRPHWNTIPDYVIPKRNAIKKNGKYICRFGKKSAVYDLLQQTSGAYNQDMGITSIFEPIDPYSLFETDPEVLTQTIHDIVFYLSTLKAPKRRNSDDPDVRSGEKIFGQLDCANCHRPTLQTGKSEIDLLSFQKFHPYTDMLLHDMGSELDDQYTEGFALTSEWRTPALWGLGLSTQSQGGDYYLMHDGRARSIEEAILLHGGEAENSKNRFTQLSDQEKNKLLTYLKSL